MTFVGMDVHARSMHAAAIDVVSGELRRVQFGGDGGDVVNWLAALEAPVRAVYEAGPTGFGLVRRAWSSLADGGMLLFRLPRRFMAMWRGLPCE